MIKQEHNSEPRSILNLKLQKNIRTLINNHQSSCYDNDCNTCCQVMQLFVVDKETHGADQEVGRGR